ncbi:unannotated protein [freshwater metagenome]|jgi:hypothetical protein|uniref:Unannotated protein n=1 Tax=freshwater metagenome TaxID=449393 RepID=A0A6J7SEU9_9ZZZZ|nr:DUF3040 domain-containing protein [Actinomycetota bacterium]MSW36174.1 DUF3040 domain-containing protein [Actinomycetota bacterium]MSX38203.1 DUF3040 domain-containing protein [Actinomycetota bacterium]
MPLSEHEQRLLEQMERALYAEDPKFASSLRSVGPRIGSRRKAAVGVLAALLGVGLLVGGAATSLIILGVAGFLLMLLGTFLVISTMRAEPAEAAPEAGSPSPGQPPQNSKSTSGKKPKPGKKPKSGFMDRMDERFRQRREGDGR